MNQCHELKIEEQEDNDEELREENPLQETNRKQNQKLEIQQKDKDSNKTIQNPLIINEINNLSENNLDNDNGGKNYPNKNQIIFNTLLAKRGKIIDQIDTSKNISANNGGNANQSTNESENNIMQRMNAISTNNLDLFNQLSQPSYQQNQGFFANPSLSSLYPSFQNNFQQVTGQFNLNQYPNQIETISPSFLFGFSPDQNKTQIPLFKPPVSGFDNNTSSAVTPLINNQYLFYNQNSFGINTPGIFTGYNQIIPQYYQQQKTFPSTNKIGLGTLTDLDKQEGSENNNNLLNMINGNFPYFDSSGLQAIQNYNFAPLTPGTNELFNQQNKSLNNNIYQQLQQINPTDMISYPQQENINKNAASCSNLPKNISTLEQKQEKVSDSQKSLDVNEEKQSLENLFKEFNSLDAEKQKLFQMMIQQQSDCISSESNENNSSKK